MNKPEYAPLSAMLLEFRVKTPYPNALYEEKQFIHMIGVHLYFWVSARHDVPRESGF